MSSRQCKLATQHEVLLCWTVYFLTQTALHIATGFKLCAKACDLLHMATYSQLSVITTSYVSDFTS
jgi:hypothetical protein